MKRNRSDPNVVAVRLRAPCRPDGPASATLSAKTASCSASRGDEMPEVMIGSAGLRGYVAKPAGAGPWPGVVVLQEVFGLNDDIRTQADRFAEAGYLALAPDLYSHGPRLRCIRQAMRDLFTRRGRSWEYIEASRQWLLDRDDCTGATGVIGFCLG